MNEGRMQRNCVFTYVPECRGGESTIFSLRIHLKYFSGRFSESGEPEYDKVCESDQVTIEVDPTVRQIVQVCVRMNPAPSADQWKVTISGLLKTL
jgi:hypothetical protein